MRRHGVVDENPPPDVEGAGRWDDPRVGSSDLTYHGRERRNAGQLESTLYFLYLCTPVLPGWFVLLHDWRRVAARNSERRDSFPGGNIPALADSAQELIHRSFAPIQPGS